MVEEKAKMTGSRRIVLDVETHNEQAVELYKRLGYLIERKSSLLRIGDTSLEFFEMSKTIAE